MCLQATGGIAGSPSTFLWGFQTMDVKKKQPRSTWASGVIATGLLIVVGIGAATTLGTKANTTFTSVGTALTSGGPELRARQDYVVQEQPKDTGPAWAWRDRRVEERMQGSFTVRSDEKPATRLATADPNMAKPAVIGDSPAR